MNPATEHFSLTQNKYIYHYTLFYYDQSGNLIKTLPPKAIRINDSGSNPNHNNNLSTRYKYNSLNEKISRTTPDGGTSKWCYDKAGRVILSQDAAQVSTSRDANYLIYDSKGRMVETGVVANYPELENCFDQSAISYSRYKTSLLRLIKKEITVSVYDSIYLSEVGREFSTSMQKNLRNRISSVLYTEEGSANNINYKTAMHFSYDISGNLKELVNDFKGIQNASGLFTDIANAHPEI
jgi:YD repeat-containing protein